MKRIQICDFCGVNEFNSDSRCPNDDSSGHVFVESDLVERLIAIKDNIKDLISEFKKLVEFRVGYDSHIWQRAKGYWYAQFIMNLDKDHSYLGGSMCTMQDTIDSIEDDEEHGDDED